LGVKRIKPNTLSERPEDSRAFYKNVIGLDGGDGLDWILFFGTDQREVQLSVMKLDIKAHIHPDVSIEVDDVDDVYERAQAAGAEIVYPITDEEWDYAASSPATRTAPSSTSPSTSNSAGRGCRRRTDA
jgi:catechol 2,3-dioxygenase-like lactoylglutathione lyase family enzyme